MLRQCRHAYTALRGHTSRHRHAARGVRRPHAAPSQGAAYSPLGVLGELGGLGGLGEWRRRLVREEARWGAGQTRARRAAVRALAWRGARRALAVGTHALHLVVEDLIDAWLGLGLGSGLG